MKGSNSLVASYAPSGLLEIVEEIICSNSKNSKDVDYHAKEVKRIAETFKNSGPMEKELFKFATSCFEQGEKFVVFCYHHTVAKTVHEILNDAAVKLNLSPSYPSADDISTAFPDISVNITSDGADSNDSNSGSPDTSNIGTGAKNSKLKSYMFPYLDNVKRGPDDNFIKAMKAISRDSCEGVDPLSIVDSLNTDSKKSIRIREFFNSPFYPMALVATNKDSEGIDLHRYCRILVHYELGYRPEALLQANGRVRRVGSLAGRINMPVLYYYPYLADTRSEALTKEVVKRVERFGHFMGGVPKVTEDDIAAEVAQLKKSSPPEMPELDFTNGGYCKALHLP